VYRRVNTHCRVVQSARTYIFIKPWVSALSRYDVTAKRAGIQRLLREANSSYGEDSSNTPVTGLRELLQEQREGTYPHFFFTTFDYERKNTVLFRSYALRGAPNGIDALLNISLTDAINATTNAPILYFNAPVEVHAEGHTYKFWDGGVTGLNNPIERAVIEALACGIGKEKLRILSLGTGSVKAPHEYELRTEFTNAIVDASRAEIAFAAPPSRGLFGLGGLLADIKHMAQSIVELPPDAALMSSWFLLMSPSSEPSTDPIVRMSPYLAAIGLDADEHPVTPGGPPVATVVTHAPEFVAGIDAMEFPEPPTLKGFKHLLELQLDTDDIASLKQLGEAWTKWGPQSRVRNQPVIKGSVGDVWFADACKHWKDIWRPLATEAVTTAPQSVVGGSLGGVGAARKRN
jgi:hypothetical protein